MQVQQVNGFMQGTERTIGLKVSWIRTEEELLSAGKAGLFKSYCDIFAEEPYEEYFEPEGVREYFAGMLAANGLIFTAEKAGQVVAFAASIPLSQKSAVVPVVAPYVDINSSAYFAEDGVALKLRRTGISRFMKTLLLNSNRMMGFETMVLRTSIKSEAQISAVQDIGFRQIKGLSQEVGSLKRDMVIRPDTRIFFTFNLNQQESQPL